MANRPSGNKHAHAEENDDEDEANNSQQGRVVDMKIMSKNDLKKLSMVHNIPLHIDQVHNVINNFIVDYISHRLESSLKVAKNAGDGTLCATHL